ncbi:glutaredoxin family protein [Maioricimonas sp. JC845]|uniref:glutaredoxin family protein n=1 Tax=Maioricimonas sp. JC845 TaxID=3232138 RepID=UPI00345ADD2A
MQNQRPTAAAATVMLFLGLAGLLLLGIEQVGGLPWTMPRFWYSRGLIIGGFFAISAICGAMLQWRLNHPHTDWQPRELGDRFESLVFYTKEACPLCDEAREVLSRYRQYLPPVVEVDIETDPQIREQFCTCVPVVEVDGRVRFRGRVSEPLLRRLIDGAPVHE